MKRIFTLLVVLMFIAAIAGAFLYLVKKSKKVDTVYQTEVAEITDIVKKTVATGSVVPRRVVDVKPKVTGVLTELKYENPGQAVKIGDPIGKISIIPDAQALNSAESQIRTAQIALDNAKRELDRNEELAKKGVVADAELQTYRTQYALRKQESELAGSSPPAGASEGATRGHGQVVDADRQRDVTRWHGDRRAGQGRASR